VSWFNRLFHRKSSDLQLEADVHDILRQRNAVLRDEFQDLFLSGQPTTAPSKPESPPQPCKPEPAPEAQPAAATTETLPERLIAAAENVDAPEVKRLLGGERLDPDTLGAALIRACWTRRGEAAAVEIVKLLLEAGADINHQDDYRDTALMYAVRGSSAELVELLVRNGADPLLPNIHGHTPVQMAGDDETIIQALRRARPAKVDGSTLVAAAKSGMAEVVRQALDAGVDINSEDEYGSPALLVAAQSGFPDIVRMLLEHGAKANTATKDGGETALTAAICGHNPEVVRLLIAAGADVNQRRRFDNGTPLGIADWLGDSAIFELLREAGGRT
jgi:ankyrin repeat protein